ncbi:MAG TPA: SDR family NAD(P)-dependent oxidoreductase [Solirubrobacterales bacterium]|jgi:NAD(P)-dependent dehydrogenase (short-subunit alcohol dehydrogenase family)
MDGKLLEGKVAAITGGASGMGRGTANRLAEQGAKVAVLDAASNLGAEVLSELEDAGADTPLFIETDIRSEDSVAAAFAQIAADQGATDIVVNCAGIREISDPLDLPIEEWDNVVAVNLRGTYLCCQQGGRQMREAGKGGAMVLFSSTAGQVAYENRPAYTASKFGVVGLTKSLARDLGPRGVRVNCIVPGIIRTPFTEVFFGEEQWVNNIPQVVPLATHGTPQQIADGVLYLVSDLSSYVTGAVLNIDGGHAMIAAQATRDDDSVFGSRLPPREPTKS